MHIQWWSTDWGPAPAWVWILTLIVLPLANEAINRAKWTTAQSLLQVVVRTLQVPFGRVPLIGDVLAVLARSDQPVAQPVGPASEPQRSSIGPLLLLAIGVGLGIAGCGATAPLYRVTAEAAVIASAGYRALDRVDAEREAQIAERARRDDVDGATTLRDRWRPEYRALRLTLDEAARAIEEAWALLPTADGGTAPASATRESMQRLIRLKAQMVSALASIGVNGPVVAGAAP